MISLESNLYIVSNRVMISDCNEEAIYTHSNPLISAPKSGPVSNPATIDPAVQSTTQEAQPALKG